MASIFSGFLDNLLNPGGNLKDYQHAARLYADNLFRLSPKVSFLYFTNIRLSSGATQILKNYSSQLNNEINMLVKEIDLPKFTAEITTKNQYNRKKNLQTRIDYQPINITFHDDNLGLTTFLMEAYYKYYNADGRSTRPAQEFAPRNTYSNETAVAFNYGLDDGPAVPFFDSITIYQLARRTSTAFTLVNPIIDSWNHDNLSQSEGNRTLVNEMSIRYESVIYDRDTADASGFDQGAYDATPSPLSAGGGGTGSLVGPGGILDGIGDIANDAADGQVGLGSIITGANVIRNAGNLSLGGIAREGLGLITNALRQGGSGSPGGIPNIVIPSGGFTEGSTVASPVDAADNKSPSSNQSSSSLNSSGIDGIVT